MLWLAVIAIIKWGGEFFFLLLSPLVITNISKHAFVQCPTAANKKPV